MIFSAFGNVPTPFNRLAKAIDQFASASNEKVIVQSGHTTYTFQNATGIAFMNQSDFKRHLKQASVVVLQGGWGGISEASDMGCRIVAVPRIQGSEHNHDQIQLVKRLEELEILLAVYNIHDLQLKIEEAKLFNFKPITRGSAAEAINNKLHEWFKDKFN